MTLTHVDQLAVFYEPEPAQRLRVGRLVLQRRMIYFEYDPEFLRSRLELSPFRLPLSPDVIGERPAAHAARTIARRLAGKFDERRRHRHARLGERGGAAIVRRRQRP